MHLRKPPKSAHVVAMLGVVAMLTGCHPPTPRAFDVEGSPDASVLTEQRSVIAFPCCNEFPTPARSRPL